MFPDLEERAEFEEYKRGKSDGRAELLAEIIALLQLPLRADPWAKNESGYTREVWKGQQMTTNRCQHRDNENRQCGFYDGHLCSHDTVSFDHADLSVGLAMQEERRLARERLLDAVCAWFTNMEYLPAQSPRTLAHLIAAKFGKAE
jgi:hypothetical protein